MTYLCRSLDKTTEMATLSEGTQVIIGKTAVAVNPLMQSRSQASYNKPARSQASYNKPAHDILSESLDICKEKYNSNEEISHRMHAWLRENSATERLIERVIESEKQIRDGEVMTAEEVDEVMAMDLQWLR